MLSTRIPFSQPVNTEKNLKFHITLFSFDIAQLTRTKFDEMENQAFHRKKETKNIYPKHFLFCRNTLKLG